MALITVLFYAFLKGKTNYLSNSVSLLESLKPLANGLLSIFNLVICNKEKVKAEALDLFTEQSQVFVLFIV